MENRKWMYERWQPNGGGYNAEFLEGVEKFITFAISQVHLMDGEKIRCPCSKCKNGRFHKLDDVRAHLYRKGFLEDYFWWTSHGESPFASMPVVEEQPNLTDNGMNLFGIGMHLFDNLNPTQRMVFDAAGPSFVPPPWFDPSTPINEPSNNDVLLHETHVMIEEEMNMTQPAMVFGPDQDNTSLLSQKFFEVLRASEEPLYHGSSISKLAAVGSFMELKTKHNLSQAGYSALLEKVGNVLPTDHTFPTSFYEMQKLIADLGLPQQKIHMCANGCMLFWKDDVDATECKFCNSPRYKCQLSERGKPIPNQVLRYLPLIPRLQRLYAMEETALEMRWHANHQSDEGFVSHPSDGEAWKHFDRTFPDFASEVRNVRLCLCTDGLYPFGKFGRPYSIWPVIVTPYNLPPNMCMQSPYLFLSTIFPGPKNPKKLIDIGLQPLLDELLLLWSKGVRTFDVSTGEYFNMRAALMWTVNDFPALGMLSGWSTAGVHACPECMMDTKAFWLKHGRKASWFDEHRRFTEESNPVRMDKKHFYKGRVETRSPPSYLDGHQIWECVRHFPTAMEEPHRHPEGFGDTHKFTKQGIFWSLPYWKHHLIRHSLDVMHTEKNVFENVFNTVMDFKDKTKDKLSSRKDLQLYCHRRELEVDIDYEGPKPKAVYTLSKEKKKELLAWLKTLRFLDGHVSNIARCVQLQEGKVFGMKSHDCHVFMQRLLPIAFKELLPVGVWGPLAELSLFFQSICSSTLDKKRIEDLERATPLLLCQLERIFPPSFFDSMEHLIVHLPRQTRLLGPVQYYWMYPFERNLSKLKGNVRSPQTVEASIVEAYLFEEITNFTKHYPKPQNPFKRKSHTRYEGDETIDTYPTISIFNHPGHPSGKHKIIWMKEDEDFHIAHTWILLNCPEVDLYIEEFLRMEGHGDPNALVNRFRGWFYDLVINKKATNDPLLVSLAWGPSKKVLSWPAYFINGFKFETQQRGVGKRSMNSGVCVKASNHETDGQVDFFGLIEEILEFEFPGLPCKKIVLFKCLWYDPASRGTKTHPLYRFQEINVMRRYNKNDPFVFAQQCIQVYYANYPGASRSRADWRFVCKTKPRARIEKRWTNITMDDDLPLQSDVIEGDGVLGSINIVPTTLDDPADIHEGSLDDNEEDFEREPYVEEGDFPSDSDIEGEEENNNAQIHYDEDDDY